LKPEVEDQCIAPTLDTADKVVVATVSLEADRTSILGDSTTRNPDRLTALEDIVSAVVEEIGNAYIVILFPGGWFSAGPDDVWPVLTELEEDIAGRLLPRHKKVTVVFGADGRGPKDQFAVAMTYKGTEAVGRKFHPAPGEEDALERATSHTKKEKGRPRVLSVAELRIYLCICYDAFGIRQLDLPEPRGGVDAILDLVHAFYPKGKGMSGESYYAKHGFAGASKQWGCPVFGAAVFVARQVPTRWPSGVLWNQGDKSTKKWKYRDNPIIFDRQFSVDVGRIGRAIVSTYDLTAILAAVQS